MNHSAFTQIKGKNDAKVGDTWNYADPALNEIVSGGFPTLTLDSRGGTGTGGGDTNAVAAPTNLVVSGVIVKNKKNASAVLQWTDNATNETGYLIQRAEDPAFTLKVTNVTIGPDATIYELSVTRGKTYYFRILAFNDTVQSDWSNTASVDTP